MKSLRPFIVLASILFLLVEIYEPSTSFVRATVIEKDSVRISRVKSPKPMNQTGALLETGKPRVTACAAHPEIAVSHSSTLLAMLIFTSAIQTISTKNLESFSGHEGIHFIFKRPPITA